MAKLQPTNRDVYQTSGRVRLLSLLWWTFMATLAGLLVSALMMLCGMIGFYLIVLVPLAAGAIAGGLAMLVVKQSHCRNKLLAGLMGAFVGVVAYLGHYHLDFLREFGFEHWHHVEALPFYMMARWEVDTIGKVGRDQGPPSIWMNALLSLVELGLMSCIAGVMAYTAASKPYAESARCWMTSKQVQCPVGSSLTMVQSLNDRNLESLESAVTPMESDDEGYCQLDFWMCPRHRDPDREEPMLLTATEFGPANKDGNRAQEVVFNHWVIDPSEVIVFAKKLPALVEWLQGEPRGEVAAEAT